MMLMESKNFSTSSVMLRVARHEGVGSLWSGLQPALVMSVPGTVLYFAAYEAARDAVAAHAPNRQLREQAPLLAGGGLMLPGTAALQICKTLTYAKIEKF